MSNNERRYSRGPMPPRPIRGEYYSSTNEKVKHKGEIITHNYDFLNEKEEEEEVKEYESISHDIKPHMVARMIFVSLFLIVVATALEFLRIKLNFLPTFLELDLSIFPEFVALLFYGPAIGIAIVMLKNVLHMLLFLLIHGNISYVGELSNCITDIIFILFAFIFYGMVREKFDGMGSLLVQRVRGLLISGTGSAIVTSVVSLPIMKFVIYPLFVKYFEANGHTLDFLQIYIEKNPNITSIWQGLINFNLPFEIVKLILVTIVATIAYVVFTIKDYR